MSSDIYVQCASETFNNSFNYLVWMIWQDLVMMFANIIFVFSLVPQLILGFREKKGHVSLITSGLSVLGLSAIVICLFTLGLFFSSIIAAITCLLWLTLFIQKIVYKN